MFIPQLDLKTALSSKEHLPGPSRTFKFLKLRFPGEVTHKKLKRHERTLFKNESIYHIKMFIIAYLSTDF